jgi:hypothetical protein
MIHGLGCAAELVTRNLKIYQENMLKMRHLLEQLLVVRIFNIVSVVNFQLWRRFLKHTTF